MSQANTGTVRFRYWDYPEPGPAALSLLPPSPVRDQLEALLAEGDATMIEDWLATADVPEDVRAVLRRGLRGEEADDAVEAASLTWEDRTGTRTACVVRRQGQRLVYEVLQDGMSLGERETDDELRGPAILKLMLTSVYDVEDDEGLTPYLEAMERLEAFSDYHDDLGDYEDWMADLDRRLSLASRDIEGKDFAGRDLSGLDLAGLRASRAILEGAVLCRTGLDGADLYAAVLRHANLRGATLRDAVLQGADLEGARLEGAELRHADLRFACLRDTRLCGADLRHADTHGADFTRADLTGCCR